MFAFVASVLTALLFTMVIGIPLLIVVLVFALVWQTVGFIAIGTVVAARAGKDNYWAGLFVGAALNTAFLLIPVVGPVFNVAVLVLGVGAGLRVSFGSGGVSKQSERSVGPAHRT